MSSITRALCAVAVLLLSKLPAIVELLRTRSFRLFSEWWSTTITAFYKSGKRQLVLRVGRRGGKSKVGELIAVLEMLFGDHDVPAGDIGYFAFVSISRDEANQRIRNIRAMLDAIGVAYTATADTIELVGRNRGAKVLTNSIAGTSGFTCIGVWYDEMAKARDSETGANPAREVLASLKATLATQKNARVFLSSSAFGTDDAHAEAFDQGDTEYQMVAYAPTWVANDTITEADCRALEPDEKVFLREYAAIPQSGLSMAFDPEHAALMFERDTDALRGWAGEPALVLDPSSMRNDAFTSAIVWWAWPSIDEIVEARVPFVDPKTLKVQPYTYISDGFGSWAVNPDEAWRVRPCLVFAALEVHSDDLPIDDLAYHLGEKARAWGARDVFSDQRESYAWRTLAERQRLKFHDFAWTAQNKQDAVMYLRRSMRDRQIAIPPDASRGTELEQIKRELAAFSERLTAAGNVQFRAKGSGHDDLVALLITATIADAEGFMKGSPVGLRRGGYRREETTSAMQADGLLSRNRAA